MKKLYQIVEHKNLSLMRPLKPDNTRLEKSLARTYKIDLFFRFFAPKFF
jgi:hypothetical protein